MGTVIRLNGFVAENAELPVNPIYNKQGLELALRYTPSEDPTHNYAGNSVTVTTEGEPSFDSAGVIIGYEDGFSLNIPEPKELTAFCVFSEGGQAASAMLIGNYDSTDGSKSGIALRATGGKVGSNAHRWTGTENANFLLVASDDYSSSGLVWCAMSLSGTVMKLYWSVDGVIKSSETGVLDFANREIDADELLGIGVGSPSDSFTGVANVSESLLYSRALSDSEIEDQYHRSKAYFESLGLVWAN